MVIHKLFRKGQGKNPKDRAAVIAEAAASIVILVPLAVLLIVVIVESSYAFLIKSSMSEAARVAARDMAVIYGREPAIAGSRALQDAMVFDNIRIANMVNDSRQFDNPVFNTGAVPHFVTVKVRYTSNQYGLPPFPYPDPLNLGNLYVISAESTYRLE